MKTDTEYDTIVKARGYLGMIISAATARGAPQDPVS